MKPLPFQSADPTRTGFQFLENLATAYWYSESLFAAIELRLFDHIEKGYNTPGTLAEAARCKPAELSRLIRVLRRIGLIHELNGRLSAGPAARTWLVSQSPEYMGDFLRYRQYMQPRWQQLSRQVSRENRVPEPLVSEEADYETRNFQYVRSLDRLARQKAREILPLLDRLNCHGPVLDIGGGAGTLLRAVLEAHPHETGVLFDLPEVIRAARRIYNHPEDWSRISAAAGDFRFHPFADGHFGLIVMSNFLHAYGPDTAKILLKAAVRLLTPDGILLVHDYFPDRRGRTPHKGPLYDLCMMLNTYDGVCHDSTAVARWLQDSGMRDVQVRDLDTDSSVIVAGRQTLASPISHVRNDLVYTARRIGFQDAALIPAHQVITAPWVRMKCRFGCREYGKSLQCPPYAMTPEEFRALLADYSQAIMVQDMPPGRDFHRWLLELEQEASQAGFHKALAFGAGPCTLCKACPPSGLCRYPEQVRPSMEACGIDVYATARNAGFYVEPANRSSQYVRYFGILLVE